MSKIKDLIGNQGVIWCSLENQAWNQVRDQVDDNIRSDASILIWERIRNLVRINVKNQILIQLNIDLKGLK